MLVGVDRSQQSNGASSRATKARPENPSDGTGRAATNGPATIPVAMAGAAVVAGRRISARASVSGRPRSPGRTRLRGRPRPPRCHGLLNGRPSRTAWPSRLARFLRTARRGALVGGATVAKSPVDCPPMVCSTKAVARPASTPPGNRQMAWMSRTCAGVRPVRSSTRSRGVQVGRTPAIWTRKRSSTCWP